MLLPLRNAPQVAIGVAAAGYSPRMKPGGDSVVTTVEVRAPLTHVFEVFTRELGDWWPAEYTFSSQRLAGASIEHLEGGSWFEVDVDGNRTEWGEVRTWEAPDRLVLSWRISPDRKQESTRNASEVEVRFTSLGAAGTQVLVEHRDFAQHGEGGEAMRQGMASEQGWSRILDGLRRAASWPDGQQDDGHQVL